MLYNNFMQINKVGKIIDLWILYCNDDRITLTNGGVCIDK